MSGDLAVERACAEQSSDFAIFGSGVSQDFVDYKLQLYEKVRPTIVTIGSSRVMQFRNFGFEKSFLNMGGVAGNLAVLRSTLEAMLAVHKPEVVLLGLDFWWFMPEWHKNPFLPEPVTKGSYQVGLEALKKPWYWLLSGKISCAEFFWPVTSLFGSGFRAHRYGIMAQQTDDGFGSDGSWYYSAELTGQKKPFDYQFQNTLRQVEYGIKAFYQVEKGRLISEAHLDAFAEIYCRLRSRGIHTFVFLPPLSQRVLEAMKVRFEHYPHLFLLANALKDRGIQVLDATDPRRLGSSDCEFIDGFHGGEVTYLRLLRQMSDQWPGLLVYLNMDKIQARIRANAEQAMVRDPRVTALWETDFMAFGCKKKQPDEAGLQ
ncbi:MAG: hypothetical protein IK079_05970 [Desulfovibrio sp.]|nr:hypothetical protein [Desulfovibrio sp.]